MLLLFMKILISERPHASLFLNFLSTVVLGIFLLVAASCEVKREDDLYSWKSQPNMPKTTL